MADLPSFLQVPEDQRVELQQLALDTAKSAGEVFDAIERGDLAVAVFHQTEVTRLTNELNTAVQPLVIRAALAMKGTPFDPTARQK